MQNMIKSTILALTLCALPCLGVGQLQTQLSGGTNAVAAGTTNTYAVYGDVNNLTNGIPVGSTGPNSFLFCGTAKDFNVSITFLEINTGSAACTETFKFAGGNDLANWTNNLYSFTHTTPATCTNWVTMPLVFTNCPVGVALRTAESPTTSSSVTTLTNLYVRGIEKK